MASQSDSEASTSAAPAPLFSEQELLDINAKLAGQSPQDILTWAIDTLPEGALWQTTAFGLTGLASLAMISDISLARDETHLVPLIFLDTLHHFPATLDLATRAAERYLAELHTFRPLGKDGKELTSAEAFEAEYGPRLWETEEDMYDYLVKVEPSHRAYTTLGVRAVLTGRRRSQGAERAALPIVEVDSTGLVKINPLIEWGFKQVKEYIDEHDVPYNELLDSGYKSIGDWHSTAPPTAVNSAAVSGTVTPASDADERSGRWAAKQGTKTECGLHKDYFKMKKQFEKRVREEQLKASDEGKAGSESVGALDAQAPVDGGVVVDATESK